MPPELLTHPHAECPSHGPVLVLSEDQGPLDEWMTLWECPEPGCGYGVAT